MSTIASEITEVENLLAVATFDGVKGALNAHLAKLKRSEADLAAKKEREATAQTLDVADKKPVPVVVSKTAYIPIEDFAWDQGEYTQTISIFVDLDGVGAAKDRVETNFTANTFDLKVTGLNGKNYRLFKDNLEKNIVPDKCKAIIKANKIVLKLQKVKGEYSYEQWSSLTAKKKSTTAEPAAKKDPMGGKHSTSSDKLFSGSRISN